MSTLTTDQKIRNRDAPSIRAASISSSGTARIRYWRRKNTPNALTRVGRITAGSRPIRCSLFINM